MNKTYVIIGDSWGAGEWPEKDLPPYYEMPHRGLAQYLEEDGNTVYNLSQGGDANLPQVANLNHICERVFVPAKIKIDKVFAFKTEYTRDIEVFEENNINNITTVCELESWCNSFYYTRLSEFSIQYNIPVVLIGGCADTIWIDKFSEEYPGVTIACQSMTNLLTNNNPRIGNPAFVTNAGTIFSKEVISMDKAGVTNTIGKAIERQDQWRSRRDLFWPDGVHPNRHGHLVLYNYLRDNNIL